MELDLARGEPLAPANMPLPGFVAGLIHRACGRDGFQTLRPQ